MTLKDELLDKGYRVALIATNTPATSDVPLADLAVPDGAIADPVPEMDDELGCKGALDLGVPGGERPLIMSMAMYRQWCEELAHDPEGMYRAMEAAVAATTVKERLLAAGYRVVVSYYPPECAGGGEPLPLVEVDIPEGTLVTLAEPEYHGGLSLLMPGWDPEDAPVAMRMEQYRLYCDAMDVPEEEYQWMAEQVGA
jgi:hypothetical protein